MNPIIESYLPLVDFLEAILGSNSEIVLHDLSDINHSVVAIRNSHVSGRSVGAPACDLALRAIHESTQAGSEQPTNLVVQNLDHDSLRSTSLIIRDGDKVIGMLCVNTDTSLIDGLIDIAAQTARVYLGDRPSSTAMTDAAAGTASCPGSPAAIENLATSTSALVSASIAGLAASRGLDPHHLCQSERIDIIRELEGNGMFQLKGAVCAAAEALKISEPSVYRYLQKIRKEP